MKDYIEQAILTESPINNQLINRLAAIPRSVHAAMGLCTETGELLDMLKKHIFYAKPLDVHNLVEELGDLLWYMALIMDEYDLTFEQCMRINIEKLRKRYPNNFTEYDALNRDLNAEREILEQ